MSMFHDDSMTSFFRRPEWSPDGSFVALPAGMFRRPGAQRAMNATGARAVFKLGARVALSIVDFDNPYEQLLIRGHVVDVRPDSDLVFLDRLAREYTGQPFARRKWRERAVYVIEPELASYYRSPLVHEPTV